MQRGGGMVRDRMGWDGMMGRGKVFKGKGPSGSGGDGLRSRMTGMGWGVRGKCNGGWWVLGEVSGEEGSRGWKGGRNYRERCNRDGGEGGCSSREVNGRDRPGKREGGVIRG